MTLSTHICASGEVLFYTGSPDLSKLDGLAQGPGDVWHSSRDQGYRNAFPDMVYYAITHWWYLLDFDAPDRCISWRVPLEHMVIRKSAWEASGGVDERFSSPVMRDVEFGFRLLWICRAVPMYIRGLFSEDIRLDATYQDWERYLFYLIHVRKEHSHFMLFRKLMTGSFPTKELRARAFARSLMHEGNAPIARTMQRQALQSIAGDRRVTVVIPTMRRQEYTRALLEDYAKQTLLPLEVIVVDGTPEEERDPAHYANLPEELAVTIVWQKTLGNCRARNEAIAIARGDYIIFGDDDTRILPDFVENHIAFLESTGADACNGLDIRAEHHTNQPADLRRLISAYSNIASYAGVTGSFNNANTCVRMNWVRTLTGNDLNFDTGYGEDGDFGFSLVKRGAIVLLNNASVNLHLKPPAGGARWWGTQAAMRKKRKRQPWEIGRPVRAIYPRPSPTIMYGMVKHFPAWVLREWWWKYLLKALSGGPYTERLKALLTMPYRILQIRESRYYASQLVARGVIHE